MEIEKGKLHLKSAQNFSIDVFFFCMYFFFYPFFYKRKKITDAERASAPKLVINNVERKFRFNFVAVLKFAQSSTHAIHLPKWERKKSVFKLDLHTLLCRVVKVPNTRTLSK